MFRIWWLNFKLIMKWECNFLLFLLYLEFSKIFKLILKRFKGKNIYIFLVALGIKSGPHVCQVGTVPLSYIPAPEKNKFCMDFNKANNYQHKYLYFFFPYCLDCKADMWFTCFLPVFLKKCLLLFREAALLLFYPWIFYTSIMVWSNVFLKWNHIATNNLDILPLTMSIYSKYCIILTLLMWFSEAPSLFHLNVFHYPMLRWNFPWNFYWEPELW